MTTSPTCIVAYTSEDDRLKDVRQAAIELARSADARLILYDIDAASPFSDPLPNWWSGEGDEKLFGDILLPEDLEAAGRHPLATQVRAAREAGVEAYAWLPGDKTVEALAEYAENQGADLIMLPESMADPGFFKRLRGQTADRVAEEAEMPVAIVHHDGELEFR